MRENVFVDAHSRTTIADTLRIYARQYIPTYREEKESLRAQTGNTILLSESVLFIYIYCIRILCTHQPGMYAVFAKKGFYMYNLIMNIVYSISEKTKK